MRIDGNRPENDAAVAQNQKVDRAAGEARQAASARTSSGDRVALSSDAALASQAARAATETPDVRTELVDRMRGLMERGELGTDVEGLANSLIDAMLEQK